MNPCRTYIDSWQVKDIPWHRLTTPYGRAADFPQYLEELGGDNMTAINMAFKALSSNIEHQDTLWPCAPFAMIFLLRQLEQSAAHLNEQASYCRVSLLLDLFRRMAVIFHFGEEMEHADPLPKFSDMLDEAYLWSEEYDEEADELRYEEEEVYPDDLFYSFYYYSYQVLLCSRPVIENINHPNLQEKVDKLLKELR